MLRRTPPSPPHQTPDAASGDQRPGQPQDREVLARTQRGLHWLDWLSQRPGAARPLAIVLFVAAMGWMCVTRWSACLGGGQ